MKNKKIKPIVIVWIVIAVACFAVFWVPAIRNLFTNNSKPSSSTSSSYSSSSKSLAKKSKKPTEKPTEKSSENTVYKVNHTYNHRGVKVTITKYEEYVEEFTYSEDIHLMRAFVEIINDSDKEDSFGRTNFNCYVNNKAVDFSYYGDDRLGFEDVAPGRYMEGWLYIDADKDDEVELEYFTDWAKIGDYEKIIFKLN